MISDEQRKFMRLAGLTDAQIEAFPAFEAEQRRREALSSGTGDLEPEILKILKVNGMDPVAFADFERKQREQAFFVARHMVGPR